MEDPERLHSTIYTLMTHREVPLKKNGETLGTFAKSILTDPKRNTASLSDFNRLKLLIRYFPKEKEDIVKLTEKVGKSTNPNERKVIGDYFYEGLNEFKIDKQKALDHYRYYLSNKKEPNPELTQKVMTRVGFLILKNISPPALNQLMRPAAPLAQNRLTPQQSSQHKYKKAILYLAIAESRGDSVAKETLKRFTTSRSPHTLAYTSHVRETLEILKSLGLSPDNILSKKV